MYGRGVEFYMQAEHIQNSTEDDIQAPLSTRLMRLVLSVAALVLVIFLARYPIQMIPAFTTYSEAIDRNNLHPGALYYSDVPVTLDSERFTRNAVQAVDEQNRQERAARAAKQ